MKTFQLVALLLLITACGSKNTNTTEKVEKASADSLLVPEFQTLLDSAKLDGTILLYDLKKDVYYSNDFDWAQKGQLPASTFKIPNSIIALETGVVENDSTLFKWNGEKRMLPIWEQDLIFREAFHYSCVPCYQEIARNIGVQQMNEQLNRLNYGNMKVDTASIDMFWLKGESKISAMQQIDFLKRLVQSNLPISKRTDAIIKQMMVIEKNDNYALSGKTGWSISGDINNGWFVGFVESSDDVYFFATNVEPQAALNLDQFPEARKEVTYNALRQLDIIN